MRTAKGLVAFGNLGKTSVAWTVDPSTLAVTRVELPDAAAGSSTKGSFAIAVSPDGRRVLTCGDDRWPTLRDAATMAAVKVYTGIDKCQFPRFTDDGHVLVDRVDAYRSGRSLDLASGKTTATKVGAPIAWPGPGKRSAMVESKQVAITTGGREVASYATGPFLTPVWLSDGGAVVAPTPNKLTVLPAAAGKSAQSFDLPARLRRMVAVPGTTKLFFQAGPHRLGVIDAATGQTTSAEGTNLGDVVKIAVQGGVVVSGAERVRVWRGGAVAATGPLAIAETIDVDAGRPALYATLDGVYLIDMATGAVEAIDDHSSSTAADRHGDTILYDADDRVMRRTPAGATNRWFRRSDDFFITDIDAATGRVAMTDDDSFYVMLPDEGELFGFHAFDCQDPLYLYLERGKTRAAAYDGVTVHLYDTAARKGLGGIELTDDNVEALAFIAGSSELVLVGDALYLWDPVADKLLVWQVPAEHAGIGSTSVATDPSGSQIAVGFSDGAVLFVTVAYVRAHAEEAGADVATFKRPASLRCKGKKMAGSIAEVGGPEDGADDEYEDEDEYDDDDDDDEDTGD